MVARDDVRVRGDQQPGGVHAAGLEPVDLLEQHVEVDHDAVADHRGALGAEDAGRQQVEGVLLAGDHQGVAGVVAAGVAHRVVDAVTQLVGRLALALVAPLRTDDHDSRHCLPLFVRKARGNAERALATSLYRFGAQPGDDAGVRPAFTSRELRADGQRDEADRHWQGLPARTRSGTTALRFLCRRDCWARTAPGQPPSRAATLQGALGGCGRSLPRPRACPRSTAGR